MITRNRVPTEVKTILVEWAAENINATAGRNKAEVHKMFMKFLRAHHPQFRAASVTVSNVNNEIYRQKKFASTGAPVGRARGPATVTLSFRAMAALNKWFEANLEVARSLTLEELTSSVNAEFENDDIFAGAPVTKAIVASLVHEYGVELPTRFRDGKTKANYKFAVIAADMVKIADALKERGWIGDISQETRNFARGIFAQED